MSGHHWSDADREFLRANWPAMSDVHLARLLHRTPTAIHDQRVKMRLVDERYSNAHRRFTTEDLQFMRDNHATMNLDELAAAMDRPWTSIRGKLRSMGLYAKHRPSQDGRGGRRNAEDQALYSVYDGKTGEPVAIALPSSECCRIMGITRNSFYSMGTRFRAGHYKRFEIYRDDIDDADE